MPCFEPLLSARQRSSAPRTLRFSLALFAECLLLREENSKLLSPLFELCRLSGGSQ